MELTKTPKGTQLEKVKELQVIRTMYSLSAEPVKELAKETVVFSAEITRYTFFMSNPSYGYEVAITEPVSGQTVTIVESSAYYATVQAIWFKRRC